MKSKSTVVKEKLTNYIKNEQTYEERHVSNTDRVGKRYRNMASVFTIGDEEEGMFGVWGRGRVQGLLSVIQTGWGRDIATWPRCFYNRG